MEVQTVLQVLEAEVPEESLPILQMVLTQPLILGGMARRTLPYYLREVSQAEGLIQVGALALIKAESLRLNPALVVVAEPHIVTPRPIMVVVVVVQVDIPQERYLLSLEIHTPLL